MSAFVARWLVMGALLWPACAPAQAPRVPYVPTPQDVVDAMLQMARVTGNDYLIDLGSGDGRIVVTAAKRHGACGFGVDINPTRVSEAIANATKAGVTDKVAFYQRDLFQTDFKDATVISMYLLPRVNLELRPKLLELKPGTRLVSHDFDMGEWKADAHASVMSLDKYSGSGGESDIFLWIVPAKVAGSWRWELPVRNKLQAYAVTLQQTFQVIKGSAMVNGRTAPLQNIKLAGDELSFTLNVDLGDGLVKHEFKGKADGDRLNGTASLAGSRSQGRYDWSAEHTAQ